MPVVVDASVALAWCFRDEQSDYAARILRMLVTDTAIVPGIFALELANGLLVAERRGRLNAADIARVHGILGDLPIAVSELALDEALGSVFDLARARGLTAYDAAYLALAMREGLPLATQDRQLREAATHLGVHVID